MKRIAILLGFCLVVAMLPTFIPQPTFAMTGSGTAGDPYIIYNVTDLQNMDLAPSAYYELANDIDASATTGWNWDAGRGVYEGFEPIAFTGHFDGNGYTISSLYMDWLQTYAYVGLFSSLGSGASVANVSVLDADISNTYTHQSSSGCAAVLVGLIWSVNSWTIRQCMVSGTVVNSFMDNGGAGHISGSAGGLVGFVTYGSGGVIEKCASYVDVTMHAYQEAVGSAGGLVGSFGYHTISNCYARGDALVTTEYISYGGGFVGFHPSGTIDNCYSTGSAAQGFSGSGACTDCFWDTQTSGCPASTCGTGKTTSQMKTQPTFTDAGWDFATVWDMGGAVNDGYPYLLWWYNPQDMIDEIYQVVWFQPNYIIQGDELPNRTGYIDGEIHWGTNPAGITISHGELVPEEEYDFEPIIPSGQDIIKPEPETMIGDVDLERLHDNPLYPLVQVLTIGGFLTERLVWLGLAWLIVIAAMFGVHLGFDTREGSEKPQHFILTTITGLGLSILFYAMGIFPWWVIILMAFGLVGAIVWERQPVL